MCGSKECVQFRSVQREQLRGEAYELSREFFEGAVSDLRKLNLAATERQLFRVNVCDGVSTLNLMGTQFHYRNVQCSKQIRQNLSCINFQTIHNSFWTSFKSASHFVLTAGGLKFNFVICQKSYSSLGIITSRIFIWKTRCVLLKVKSFESGYFFNFILH
jgi:hypothetical protein